MAIDMKMYKSTYKRSSNSFIKSRCSFKFTFGVIEGVGACGTDFGIGGGATGGA